MLGTQEAIRQSQAKERREEHRARRCNLIVGCVRTSIRSREINGKKIVLRDSKLYIDSENTSETDQSSGHPFAGYYLPYPDSEYEGLVSTITHVAPILNWIYIDKDTYEVKYGVRDVAQPHLTGPFDCTRQDRRLTFDDWEGFVAVEEHPKVWALYFDRDDNGLKGKVPHGAKVLEIVLTRQERKKMKEEAQKPKVTDKEKAEEAGHHQTTYTQGADAEKSAAPDGEQNASQGTSAPSAMSAADLAKLKIGDNVPSSVSSDHAEGTVGSPTEPWGAGSMWSNQEQQAVSGAASHLAPFTPSSSIYGDDEPVAQEHEESTPRRTAYHHPYVEDEASANKDLVIGDPEKGGHSGPPSPSANQQSVAADHMPKADESATLDAHAGAESNMDHEEVEHTKQHGESPGAHPQESSAAELETIPEERLESRSRNVAQHGQGTETKHSLPATIITRDVEKHDTVRPSTATAWPDTPIAGQRTSPTVDFQVSHADNRSTADGSTQGAIETTWNRTDTEKPPSCGPHESAAEEPVAAEKHLLDEDEVQTSDKAHADVEVSHQLPKHLAGDEEPPPTPAQNTLNQPPAPQTPELGHSETESATGNLPAWGRLPDPYWDAAADTPRPSHPRNESHNIPMKSAARNFSLPRQSTEGSSMRGKEDAQLDVSVGTEDTSWEDYVREQSAPPVTTSKDPYPVEDDPTSTDTSLVETSFTAPTPYSRDETGSAADTRAETAAEKAAIITPPEQQSTQPLEPQSTQSSVTLGNPALEDYLLINSKV